MMSESKIPESSEVEKTVSSAPSQAVDSPCGGDWNLGNILYIQNIPSVPAERQAALDERIQTIKTWLIWELAKVEEAVQGKLKTLQLPADDSVASQSKRIGYRIKVIDAYRRSPWLVSNTTATQSATVVMTEDEVKPIMKRQIISAAGADLRAQAVVDTAGLGDLGFNEKEGISHTVQPHVLYFIDYHDVAATNTIDVSIKTFYYNVTLTETTPPPPPPKKGHKRGDGSLLSSVSNAAESVISTGTKILSAATSLADPALPSEEKRLGVKPAPKVKYYEAKIDYVNTTVTFNFDMFNPNLVTSGVSPELLNLGKQALGETQLRLTKQ